MWPELFAYTPAERSWHAYVRPAIAATAAVGLLVLFGSTHVRAAKSASRPTVILGTKNFSEEYLLGELYRQALEAKGFRVSYKENIGSTEIIDSALTSGKIDLYPEYTGTILSVVFHRSAPGSAASTYALADRLERSRGFRLLEPTPFSDSDEVAVLRSTAERYHLRTIADLRRLDHARVGGEPEGRHRYAGLVGLHQAYHLTGIRFVPFAGITPYLGLTSGSLDAAFVFSTDAQLSDRAKFVVLKDTKHIFGFQNVAPVVRSSLVGRLGPTFATTVNAVSRLLTLHAVIAMNRAVVVDKLQPAAVAAAFLAANGLN